ncbi:hypothetical protein BGW37DRAFT_428893 [Umbelopsis sp. PMI_123]|nr:hypothetical protein BGW37DRAFT_428893 [Umbelopsis sp. PMI_123]
MAGLPPQHTNPAQLGGNKPILLQLEEQYSKRVDDDVLKLVDSFADIVRVTEIRSAESLLGLITELKQILLLNDTKTLTQLSDTRTKALREPKTAIKSEMSKIKTELDAAIFDMENVLYRNLTSP